MSFSPVTRLAVPPIAFAVIFCASEAARRYGIPLGFCVSQRLFGIRCPGCGVTRSVAALLHGDLTAAMTANVAGPVVCAYFLVQLLCFAVVIHRRQQQRVFRWQQQNERVLLAGLLAAWLWHSVD